MPESWKRGTPSLGRMQANKQVIINGRIANELACHFNQVYCRFTDGAAGRKKAFV